MTTGLHLTSIALQVVPLSLGLHFTKPIEATRHRYALRGDREAHQRPQSSPHFAHGDATAYEYDFRIRSAAESEAPLRKAFFQFQHSLRIVMLMCDGTREHTTSPDDVCLSVGQQLERN